MRTRTRLPHIEWTVIVPAGALLLVGLLFVHSAVRETNPGLWARQLAFVGVGVGGIVVVRRLGMATVGRWSWSFYGVLLATLVALPFLAEPSTTGSDRWIGLPFGLKLQPSEFMKLGLVLALARHLRHAGVTNTLRSYLGPLAVVAVPWFFVMRQPDLGSSLVLLPVFVAMVTVSGARLAHVLGLAAAALALLLAAYHVPGVLEPYQKDRLDAFRTSIPTLVAEARELRERREHDEARALEERLSELKRGTGYQQFYSVTAIGSGGLTGAGLGQGLQNRGNRLPVRHADFIFAVIGEEWGLLGAGGVTLLHALLVAAILGVAQRTREPFGRLVCVGVAASVGGQALVNLGIATGLMPVTGLTLPLVSYGGSSIVSTLLALGCVLDVAARPVSVFFEQ